MRPLALVALLAAVAMPALAQPGLERWTAVSTTASGITGDIRLSPTRLETANASLPLAVAADVPAFKADTGTFPARILRVTRPANPPLLNANRFCTVPVRWIVVWHTEREPKANLGMAVFSARRSRRGRTIRDCAVRSTTGGGRCTLYSARQRLPLPPSPPRMGEEALHLMEAKAADA